jgi:hypothetical protein
VYKVIRELRALLARKVQQELKAHKEFKESQALKEPQELKVW